MKTIVSSSYRRGMARAMIAFAFALLAPAAVGAEVTTVTNNLGGFAQRYPSNNYPFELYTQVTHSQGDTYVVLPDHNRYPLVTRITEVPGGSPTKVTVRLDPDDTAPYLALNDPHNGYSIGIDKDGYIHVAGDMHAYGTVGDGRQSGASIYPARYLLNHASAPKIMYWVSNKPRDITQGFRFAGYDADPQRLHGKGWSYGRFFNDKEGNLYYSARVAAVDRFIGYLGVSLSAYDTVTRTWTRRGGLPTDNYNTPYPNSLAHTPNNVWSSGNGDPQTVLYWAEAGEPPHSGKPDRPYRNYQVYQVAFNFDKDNRLHFVVCGFVDLFGKSLVLHAYSDDGGLTWHRSNGDAIGQLPMRGDAGPTDPSRMTVAYDPGPSGLNLVNKNTPNPLDDRYPLDADGKPDVAVGGNGNPTYITKAFADDNGHVYALHGQNNAIWRVWNGTTWQNATNIKGNAGNVDPNGVITTWAEWGIWRNGSTTSSTPNNVGVTSPSQLGIQQTGKTYGLYMETIDGIKYAKVRKITFTPDPVTPGTGFLQQTWLGIGGRHFGSLNGTVYPLSPTSADLSPDDPGASLFIQHTTAQSNGGTANRVRGYFIPPTTGNYVFKVWGKFSAKLFVSTDESPLNVGTPKVIFDDNLALHNVSPILPGQWSRASATAPISMVANQRYFVELVHKGASSNPHVEVGASGPGGFEQLPLLASRFDAWEPAPPQIHKGIENTKLNATQHSLSVLGYDDYEESALKYAWSATGPGSVTFSAQNTNAAKNCTATFSTAGTYTLTVTVTDADGLSVTSSRQIVVN